MLMACIKIQNGAQQQDSSLVTISSDVIHMIESKIDSDTYLSIYAEVQDKVCIIQSMSR